jgi:hypothetical protein
MTERNVIGTRTEFTVLDFAALQDSGWHLPPSPLTVFHLHHLNLQQLRALRHAFVPL